MVSQTDLHGRMAQYLETKLAFGASVRVEELQSIASGWENEVHTLTFSEGGQCHNWVLRLYPGEDAAAKSTREHATMCRLHQMGYPVPRMYAIEPDTTWLGKPFVLMEWIRGETLGNTLQEETPARRTELFARFCELLYRLHRLDWRAFCGEDTLSEAQHPTSFLMQRLREWHTRIDGFGQHEFTPVIEWLNEKLPAICSFDLSLVHCDYHPANVLLDRSDKLFVIDWGNAQVLDYRFDLAFSTILMSTYGHPEMRDRLLDIYTELAGHEIADIEVFEVIACAIRLFNISTSLLAGATRLGMRSGAETMMKQNVNHIHEVHQMLTDRSGIVIPRIESLCQTLRHQPG